MYQSSINSPVTYTETKMDNKAVLHDIKHIVNTMKLISRDLPEEKRTALKVLAQHLDKLYVDLNIKFNNKGGLL